jgi:hypothetical protein
MKRKNLPTILLVVVAFGLIASMFFQLHLLNEIDYLWGEIDETYELLKGVLQQLKEARYGIQI